MIELSLGCSEPPCAAPSPDRDWRLDGEAQAATGGGEDGVGAPSAAGLTATAATVTLRRWLPPGGAGNEKGDRSFAQQALERSASRNVDAS
jgi:hypothetical protein